MTWSPRFKLKRQNLVKKYKKALDAACKTNLRKVGTKVICGSVYCQVVTYYIKVKNIIYYSYKAASPYLTIYLRCYILRAKDGR